MVVIGGGQSGLAMGYHLRRTGLSFVILDAQEEPGGSRLHAWDSLRLFSPARFSSLPGWIMEGGPDHYPARAEALEYLRHYEERTERRSVSTGDRNQSAAEPSSLGPVAWYRV